jgi:cell division protein FtsQ
MSQKKVRRKKLNLIKLFLILLILYVIGYIGYYLMKLPIKNIYIINNQILTDQEVINQAKIQDYPSFFMTTSSAIRKRLLNNPYIKRVEIKKKWLGRIYIYVYEYKVLLYDKESNQIILENKAKLNNKNINDIPILINYVPDTIYNKFITKMAGIIDSVKVKISEIEYKPAEVDNERFLLTMNDGNYVYLTLYKFETLNEYNKILPTLENKKGVLYLDSGNYFVIFK